MGETGGKVGYKGGKVEESGWKLKGCEGKWRKVVETPEKRLESGKSRKKVFAVNEDLTRC